MELLSDIFLLLRTRRKLWLIPMLVVLIGVGGLVVLTEGTIVAPFFYWLF